MNDVAVFIALCINYAILHEIESPDRYEREALGLEGVINNINHFRWFNERKKYLLYQQHYYH